VTYATWTTSALATVLLALAGPATAIELAEYPELRALIDEMVEQHGFERAKLERTFKRVRFRQEIIDAIETPKEALPYHEYRELFVTTQNRNRGQRFWKKHDATLREAQERYGVPPEVVVGILGVETSYGRNKGRFPVMDSLTTLTVAYPRRATFFRRELGEYLLLSQEINLDPMSVKGSYAGAFGIAQFIPSSYRQYAVDFNGDGKRDLIHNADDAIGSVANFLKRHGWQANAPVAADARVEGTLYEWVEKLGIKPLLSLRDLGSYGIHPASTPLPEGSDGVDPTAALVAVEGRAGPIYRLAYNNFYVITRYNRSARYAMAVYELAESVRAVMPPET